MRKLNFTAGLAALLCFAASASRAWDPNKPFIYEMKIAFETDNWTNHYSTTTVLSKSDNTVAFRVVANSTTNPTYQLVVTTQGNVGVATASPAGLFTVGNGTLTVLSNGNVGIGTTNPVAKLDVRGNTLLNGVGIWSRSRDALGTDTFSYDFVWGVTIPLKIWAFCSHWTSSYVALLETTITGDAYTGLSQWDQLNVNTSTQGGWTLSRPSNGTLRITKTAGSYIGVMNCFITIMGPQVFTDQNQ